MLRIISLCITTLLAFLINSCIKGSDVVPEENPEGGILLEITDSYGPGTGSYLDPTEVEKKIIAAHVYMFDSDKKMVEMFILDVSADNKTASKVVDIPQGDYYFVALVNFHAFPDKSVGQTLESFSKIEYANVGLWVTADPSYLFAMCSVTEPEVVRVPDITNMLGEIKISVPVGRLVAKAAVDYFPTVEREGKLTDVEFGVTNVMRVYYCLPNFIDGQIITKYYYDTTVDVQLYNFAEGWSRAGFNGVRCSSFEYAYENSNLYPKRGNSTYVAIRGTFTPEKLYNADGIVVDDSPATGTSFYRIADLDAAGYIVGYQPNYYSVDPSALARPDQKAVYYENGLCYYGIYLNTPSETQDLSKKYTVYRNTCYWFTIDSLSGAGHNGRDVIKEDKEKELDMDLPIGYSVQVVNWHTDEEEVEL